MNLPVMTAANAEMITQSDTTVIDPPYFLLVISEVGTVEYKNAKDETITLVVPTGASLPFTMYGRVRQVMNTNTTVADANLIGVR